jgi:hypothetical protein
VTARTGVALSRTAVAALVLAPALVITWAFRPGYMNADSLIEYSVTQPSGDFTDWRAPLIEKLWDAFETIGLGSPTIVLFAQTLMLVAGFYLVMRAALGRVAAGAVAAALVFTPLVLSQVMLIGRDTWLASFVVFQVGCAIQWSTSDGRARLLWLVLAIVSGLLAVATRQNAAVIELFVVVAIAAREYRRRVPERRGVRAVLVPVAIGGSLSVLAFGIVSALPRLMGARDVRPEAHLYAYDLTGMSLREDEVLMGSAAFPSQDLDVLRERWNPQLVESVIVPVGEAPVLVDERLPGAIDELGSAWTEQIRERPAAYLAVRWGLFQRILGISDPPTYVLHAGVDGPNTFGFAIANPDANEAFRNYVGWFTSDDSFITGSNFFRPWIWLGLGLAAAGALLIPRRVRAHAGALELGLVTVGAVLYECTFAVIAMGESFRYSYPAIVVSVLALTFTVATLAMQRVGTLPRSDGSAVPDDSEGGGPASADESLPANTAGRPVDEPAGTIR